MIFIEYSKSQKAFHKITLDTMLSNNLHNTFKEIETDYLPIANANDHDEADGIIAELRQLKPFNT